MAASKVVVHVASAAAGASKGRNGQGTRCRACAKPIIWPGLCYTCATKRPRLLMRPDEYRVLSTEY